MELISTIEDYEEVNREESDSEEEVSKSKSLKHRKKPSLFAKGFEFAEDGGEEYSWDVGDAIQWSTGNDKSHFSSLEAKIARAREMRQLKAEQQREARAAQRGEEVEEEEEEEDKDLGKEKQKGRRRKKMKGKPSVDEPSESDSDDGGGEEMDLSEEEEAREHPAKASFFEQSPTQQSTDISFTDMNLSRPLLKSVTALGFVTPTPIQASAIPVALMGKDICACAATGTGKTAAFMLPLLERLLFRPTHSRITRVLILLPTRELAIQVHSVGRTLARHTDIELCLAAGGLDSKSQEAALRKNPDVVIATPGRLIDHLHNAPSFNLQTVEILVLDEADRILDEHFEDQLNELIRQCPKSRQTMLFSATMTDQVEELARLSLLHPVRLFVDSNSDVASNLWQEFVRIKPKREGDREAIVTALCCRTFHAHCLVFLHTKRLAHRMRILFGLIGLKASELHGSLTQLQRIEALKKFKDGEVDYLLATDLAARGLDIERVTTVINYSMPAAVKQYIHRVGRTARAGRSGRSVTLVGERERRVLKDIVKQAKCPVKSRVIPPEVIVKYRDKIRQLEPEIKQILMQEEEEKQLRISEMEVSKARNLIEHEREIFSRPARTWMPTSTSAKRKREETSAGDVPMSKRAKREAKRKRKPETPEEKAVLANRLEQEHAVRTAKRSRKQKKMYTVPPGKDKPTSKPGKGKVKPRPVIKAFEQELTNTSKKLSKGFRRMPLNKSKGSKFKSRKRFKRR